MIKIVEGFPEFHTVPLDTVICKDTGVVIDLDDCDEKRFRLVFSTIQALKVTTYDCFEFQDDNDFIPERTVLEKINSKWIKELKENLKIIDGYPNFMDKARHFLLPFGDRFVEVVAWEVRQEECPK